VQGGFFYRFSLDRRHTIVNPEMFMTDPWPGNSSVGKDILGGQYVIDDLAGPIDLVSILSGNASDVSPQNLIYCYSFNWINDIQALGGNNNMKYIRHLISMFINTYRNTRKFWMDENGWRLWIASKRMVNWMLAYTSFASGASDSFQNDVLSSINEHFSHIYKTYKAEIDSYKRLLSLKAIFFCLCSMRNIRPRRIKAVVNEIDDVIKNELDRDDLYITRSPSSNFNIMKSLFEIRFMSKRIGIDLQDDSFNKFLSGLASYIRFLRLGDGELSNHFSGTESDIPSRQMIDSVLSVINVKNTHDDKIFGIERLTTRKIIVLISTKISILKSKFNNKHEPGINIFNFEASFGTDRIIERSDVSIVFNGHRVKLLPSSKSSFEKSMTNDMTFFSGESRQSSEFFDIAFKRELAIYHKIPKISGSDLMYLSSPFTAFARFVVSKKSSLSVVNPKTILIESGKTKCLFSVTSTNYNNDVIINDDCSESPYPSIEVFCSSVDGVAQVNWVIEEVQS
jgi:hypothetical protein